MGIEDPPLQLSRAEVEQFFFAAARATGDFAAKVLREPDRVSPLAIWIVCPERLSHGSLLYYEGQFRVCGGGTTAQPHADDASRPRVGSKPNQQQLVCQPATFVVAQRRATVRASATAMTVKASPTKALTMTKARTGIAVAAGGGGGGGRRRRRRQR